MTDIVDASTRSRMMSAIRSKDTKPELVVRRFLHSEGFRFRLHAKELPGRPDLVLPRYGSVIQVQGCFWHRHEGCAYAAVPSSNEEFWAAKLQGNVDRDLRNEALLERAGWRVHLIWECETTDPRYLHRLARALRDGAPRAD